MTTAPAAASKAIGLSTNPYHFQTNMKLRKHRNKRGEGHIPEDILRDLARLLLPQIIQMYESEEGKKQLEEWKAKQEKQKESVAADSKREGV